MCRHKSNTTLSDGELHVTKDATIIVDPRSPLVKWLSRYFVHGNKMEKDKLHFVRSTKFRWPSINVQYDSQTFFLPIKLQNILILEGYLLDLNFVATVTLLMLYYINNIIMPREN